MRVFISGPITGHDDYKDAFEDAKRKIQEWGHEVINPADLDQMMPSTATQDEKSMDLRSDGESKCLAKKTLVGCFMDEFKAALIGLLLWIAIALLDGFVAYLIASWLGGHVSLTALKIFLGLVTAQAVIVGIMAGRE